MSKLLPFILAAGTSGGSSSGALVFKGSCNFSELPTTDQKNGDTYDILDDFTLDGKNYKAGTNVAWNGTSWDPLGGANSLPSGGKLGEILGKLSDTNYDTSWIENCNIDLIPNGTIYFDDVKKGVYYWYNDGSSSRIVKRNADASVSFTFPGNPYLLIVKENTKGKTNVGTFAIMLSAYQNELKIWDFFINADGSLGRHQGNLGITLSNTSQTITGKKTFNTALPECSIVPTTDAQLVNKKYVDDSVMKFSTMPTAASTYTGKIVQYIGTTDSTYTNGYFYIGTDNSGTYSWEQLNVQPGSSGGSSKYKYYVITAPDNISSSLYTTPYQQSWFHTFTSTELDFTQIKEIVEDAHNEFLTNGIIPVIIMNFKYDYGNPTFHRQSSIIFTLQNDNPTSKQNPIFYSSYFADGFLMSCYLNLAGTWSDDEFTPTGVYYTSLRTDVQNLVLTNNTQTISGAKTFSTLPQSSVTPSNNTDLVTKTYVDTAISTAITTTLGGSY